MKKKIAIIHPRLMPGGGSESCAMQAAEVLKKEYDVVFLTMGKVDLEKLNEFYGTNIGSGDVKIISLPIPKLFEKKFDALRSYKLARLVRKLSKNFDVMVSTYNLMDLGKKGIQFVADLSFDDNLQRIFDPSPTKSNKWFYKDTFLRKCYLKLAEILPGGSKENFKKNITIANSEWTKNLLKKYLDISSEVIYPPVAGEFPQIAWAEKENGFVCLGRVSPEKQIEKIINIIREVRKNDGNIHLHIIGQANEKGYAKMIKELCRENKQWCFWDGPMFGSQKNDFIAKHKFGISGRQNEPFGIAVAEMACSGAIVFAPNGGGQVEILVDKNLTYKSIEDAVVKINKILYDKSFQEEARGRLSSQISKFSVENFRSRVRELVKQFLEER